MRMFKRRRKKKFKNINRVIANPLFLTILGLIIMAAITYPLIININKQSKINSEIKELELEISDLENKNLDLKELISYLGSNQFTEEQARLNFNLKKEGEEVVVIDNKDAVGAGNLPGQPKSVYNINKEANTKKKKFANPQRWWKYFFKYEQQ